MSHPRYPLRINVGFMINEPIGSFRELDFQFDEVTLLSELQLTDFNGTIRINRTPQGLLLDGKFTAKVVGQCVRCLEDHDQVLETGFQELFAYHSRHTSEEEYFVPEDGFIDLELLVYENMIIDIPIRTLCKPDCKGLCLECGTNLNLSNCEHVPDQAES